MIYYLWKEYEHIHAHINALKALIQIRVGLYKGGMNKQLPSKGKTRQSSLARIHLYSFGFRASAIVFIRHSVLSLQILAKQENACLLGARQQAVP